LLTRILPGQRALVAYKTATNTTPQPRIQAQGEVASPGGDDGGGTSLTPNRVCSETAFTAPKVGDPLRLQAFGVLGADPPPLTRKLARDSPLMGENKNSAMST